MIKDQDIGVKRWEASYPQQSSNCWEEPDWNVRKVSRFTVDNWEFLIMTNLRFLQCNLNFGVYFSLCVYVKNA